MGEAFEGLYYFLDWWFLTVFFAELQGSAVPQVLKSGFYVNLL